MEKFWEVNFGNALTIVLTLAAVLLYFGRYQTKLEDLLKDVSEIKGDLKMAVSNGTGFTTSLAVLVERVEHLEDECTRNRENIHRLANILQVRSGDIQIKPVGELK